MRGALRRAQPQAHQQPQRLPGAGPAHARGGHKGQDPEAEDGDVLPRGPHRALLPGGPRARRRGGRDVRARHLHAQGRGGGGGPRRVVHVEVPGLAPVREPGLRGRRVPPAALRRRAVRVPVARRHLIRVTALIEADGEWSARCAISRPSLAHAWRRPEAPAPSEESVLAARQAADRIISAAVDPGGEQGQHSPWQGWPAVPTMALDTPQIGTRSSNYKHDVRNTRSCPKMPVLTSHATSKRIQNWLDCYISDIGSIIQGSPRQNRTT